jgi:hypothetical protein
MYQFLDEHDMWSLVERNPKETWVLEKHQTFYEFMRIIFFNKNHVFLSLSSEHIVGYMIHMNKNKTK